MGGHSLLLLTLGLSCYVHCLRDVSSRHHTRNLTTTEQLTEMAERFGATNLDELGTSDESSEAPIPSRKVKRLASDEDESDSDVYQGVMGRPGVDFPILPRIPRTTFNCRSVPGPGYYADMDTDCQVFHICDGGRKISFLCPNGTIFRQSHLICDWWWTVDCGSSREHYESSAETTSGERSRYDGSHSSEGEQSPPANRNRYSFNEQNSEANNRFQSQQAARPQPAVPQRQTGGGQAARQRQRDSVENSQQNEQQNYSEQRRQNGQAQRRTQQQQQKQQQQRGSSESVRNVAPSSPAPIVPEIRDVDQRRRDQNLYSKQTEVEKQSKSYRSTTYTPPNALREGRNTYNFALNTTSVRDKERQQPAETASFVNSRRNNGSRQYEVIQRNNVLSVISDKDQQTFSDQPGSDTDEESRLKTSTATSVQQNAFAYSRKVQPVVSERRGGRQQSVRWSNGEFQTVRTTVDLPPTSRQGQRSLEVGRTENDGIFVTESSVRNSKYQSTSKQYVELDRSKTFVSKPVNIPQSPTERTLTPIVVRTANPSTAAWQFTTVAPEDLPITDIYRPTGTPFTLEDERGGQNFYTTPTTKVAAEDYVTINRKAGNSRQALPVSDTMSVTKPTETHVADEDNTEPISDIPITDVNPPKELWFTHEDFAFMSTTPSDDFDSTHITPQPVTVSTHTPTERSFDDDRLIERSETVHTAPVYVSSNNDQSVSTIVNCSGLPHDKRNDPSGATLNVGSGREINDLNAPRASGRNSFNDYSTSESTTDGTEFSEGKLTTERPFRKETISHMTASSSDLSLSITENEKLFYEKELTTDSSFDKEVSPSLWNERRTLSSAGKILDSSLPEELPQSSQSFETDNISSGKSYSLDGKFSEAEEIELKTTSLPSIQKAVSRGILAPLPPSDTTGKEYQPQGNDLQYDVTTPHSNKEEIFDSSESSHARVTETFTLVQVATISTLAEEDRKTEYDVPLTPAYDSDPTESPTLATPDNYSHDANTATDNGSRADTSQPPTEHPPAMQSVLPAEPFVHSEVLGAFAAATSRYESRNAKEISYPPTANDATQETTGKPNNASTAAESVTSFRRRIYHGKSSNVDSVSTTNSPSTSPRSNRLASSRKSVIFVEGPRRRLTTTTTTPSVIQRVLSLRQKTTPLTIPLRSAAAAKSKTTHTSEQVSKSLQPPKVQDRSEVKSLRRGSQLSKSQTGVESRINKTRTNIPPSNRPDTLNSLAVYFGLPETEMEESDVSNRITKMMNDLVGESVNNVNSSTKELPVQLPPLLTQLTRDSYSALFSLTRKMADMDEVLGYDENNNNVSYAENSREGKALYLNETQSGIESLLAKNLSGSLETSNGLPNDDVRGLRELAQIFSRALTAYLKDPTDFRKILSQARPTEPANNTFETDMTTPLYETTTVSLLDSLKPANKDDDEVLDFSDVNKAPTLRLLSSTAAPMFDSLVHAATLSKPKLEGSEDSSSDITSSKSEYTVTETASFETGQVITDSSEVVHESLHDQETNYKFLATRDPLVNQQTTVVDSTNAIAYEVNNLFVTETATRETVNDYTLPPGSQKYTGPAYGPTSFIPTARAARNRTKSRFGGFQNNGVQLHKVDTRDELVYDLIVNEEIPPLLRDPKTHRLSEKEVTYILTNNENKDALPTTATDLESLKNEGAFMLTTKASFDELTTLQDSVIPEEVNNLAVTTSNIVDKLKVGNRLLSQVSGGFSTTAIDDNLSGTPSTNEASDTVSIFLTEFNKGAEKIISDTDKVNEFISGDNLESKLTRGSIKGNGEESLIVSGTSGFGASLKQQSALEKTRANKVNDLETNYNNPQTNNGMHSTNQDKNNVPVHADSSILKTDEMTESLIHDNTLTKVTVVNMTHTMSHEGESIGQQSHLESLKTPGMGSNNKKELSSPPGLPHVDVTQHRTPSQETVTPSWEDYDVTDKQTDAMNLRGTNSSSTRQRMENEKILPLADDQQKLISHNPVTHPSTAFTGGTIKNIQIDGTSRMSVNTFTSAAPQKMETITKRTQKSRPDNEMTTKSPKVTISSKGFSFATTVDETRDILEQGRASLLQSGTSGSSRIDMSPDESGFSTSGRKVQKLLSDSSTKDRDIVSSTLQDNTYDSTLKMVKDHLSTDYSTVPTDIKSATHPFLVTSPGDKSEWENTDSKSSGAIDTQNLEPTLQQKHIDDFNSVTMDPPTLSLLTTLEAPAPINQLNIEQKSVNNHLSRTGKTLNVLTHRIDEVSSPWHHDEMTTELTPDPEVTTGFMSIEHNSEHFMSDTKPMTILENNKHSSLNKQLNEKNDLLPSTSITITSRKNKTIMSMTHEEKETLNHLQEIFSLDTETVTKAGKLFMELNETSRHALMDMMKEAASNSTMRQLVVVVVNKSLNSMDFSDVKKYSMKAQSNLPCDENTEPQVQQMPTEETTQKNVANERKRLRSAKGRQFLTTTEPPVTTYHSQDRKYQRFKTVTMPTTSVFDLITSKNHTLFDEVPTSKPGVLDHSQLSASVSEPEENVSSEADARVVELLRSLYSLAAQWG